MKKLINNVYSLFIGISLFGGFVIFLYILMGFIIGGEAGAGIMTIASKTIAPLLYKAASIAVIAGMVLLYLTHDHDLTLKKKDAAGDASKNVASQ